MLYRFNKVNVQWLADHFIGAATETRGGVLSPLLRMETTLRYLANPGFQSGVAREMGIDKSSVSKIVYETVQFIVGKGDEWIKFPNTFDKISKAKNDWQNLRGFPCTIGAIDCTHIRVEKPPSIFSDEYVNHKGYYYSMNVQATVNAKG